MVSILRAILYLRVSTEEQGKGYSLRQQLQGLQEYCKDNGIEVVGVYEDRSSGALLDRPGLDALRYTVSLGGVDLVLAQDADRITRDPMHRAILDDEFGRYETRLVALDDWGDDSHEGELLKYMKGWVSKGERLKTAERTRRGRLRKAQEGKIVGNGTAPYGFYYEDNHYHVDPERMTYVHEIFERAAAGDSMYSIVQHLNNIGAPAPKSGRWHASTIRWIISSDTYLGTFYWGKERYTTTTISKVENGDKIYKRKVVKEKRPESDWISIPVPNSGISPETIERARESLKGNVKAVSKNGGRIWELSGGVGKCSECGRHMVAHTSRNTAKRTYYYYRCRDYHACSNRKNYPAQDLETQVNDAIVDAFHPEGWKDFVDSVCDSKLTEIRRARRSDPDKTRERLARRIEALKTSISRAQDLYMHNEISRPQYDEKKATFQHEIEIVQKELSKVDNLDAEVRRVEDLRRTLKGIENPLSGHYALTEFPESHSLVDMDEMHSLGYGSKKKAAWRRQEFYRRVGLGVEVGAETLRISIGVDKISVSKDKSVSGVISAPAPEGVPGSLSRPRS